MGSSKESQSSQYNYRVYIFSFSEEAGDCILKALTVFTGAAERAENQGDEVSKPC